MAYFFCKKIWLDRSCGKRGIIYSKYRIIVVLFFELIKLNLIINKDIELKKKVDNNGVQTDICIQNCKDGAPFYGKDMHYPICKYRPTINYKENSEIIDNTSCPAGYLLPVGKTFAGVPSDSTDTSNVCIASPLSYQPGDIVPTQ